MGAPQGSAGGSGYRSHSSTVPATAVGLQGTTKAAAAQPCRAGPGPAAWGWRGAVWCWGALLSTSSPHEQSCWLQHQEPAWAQPSWGPGAPGADLGRAGPTALPGSLVPGCCWGSQEADGIVPWLVLEGAWPQSHWPHLRGSWLTGSGAGLGSSAAERAGDGPQKRGNKSESICLSPATLHSSIPGLPCLSHTL